MKASCIIKLLYSILNIHFFLVNQTFFLIPRTDIHVHKFIYIQVPMPWQHFTCLQSGSCSLHPASWRGTQCLLRKSSQKEPLKTLSRQDFPTKLPLWKYWQLPIPPVMVWDTFLCTYSPGPFHLHSSFLLFGFTLHKGSFTHCWQNYKSHILALLSLSLSSVPFPLAHHPFFLFVIMLLHL